ncbi:MAG: class I adenylate-forming enzyme family protein [Nocardioides sp.]|uniref:class I adenylate-forming enzyme family protein n=1 Tax=Nocardioides sp. TaxID=35761 RepID=UPI0039E4608F
MSSDRSSDRTGGAMPTRDEVIARITGPGERFEIVREPVLGYELPVYVHREHSLVEMLLASARYGDAEYLVTDRETITFAEHLAMAGALAAALREEYGVRPGDRVAICAANSPQWILAFWATISIGAVVVGMNSMWAPAELRHGLELTEPTALVADERRRELTGPVDLPVIDIEHDLPGLLARHAGAPLLQVAIEEDDPAVILFTSGTSGRPKGSTHSHRNVISAVWFFLLNDAVAAEMGAPPAGRRYLLANPLFHIAALHNLAVVRLVTGEPCVVHLGRFDIEEILRLIERHRVTSWGAVPTMVSRLVERAERVGLDDVDLSSLRVITVNSAPSSSGLKERLRRVLPEAGRALGTTYGLTESSTAATLASAAELAADPETVGRAIPTMEVEVRDPLGQPVPEGVEGEICLRGPQIHLGYWNNSEASAASVAEDGWFRTGDLGTLVAGGHLHISSRRSDLILRGGENIYPAEVENQVLLHPAVRECIVMGVPDADYGEAVAAVVVLHEDAGPVDQELLLEHLRPRLARYKLPTVWSLGTTPLPRNATGKVIRRDVVVTAGPSH